MTYLRNIRNITRNINNITRSMEDLKKLLDKYLQTIPDKPNVESYIGKQSGALTGHSSEENNFQNCLSLK